MYAIEASNIRKSFGTNEVLKGIDLTVPKQSVYGFLGNNGAGKSTFIKTLLGLLNYTGQFNINGQPIRFGDTNYRHQIGALVDSPSLYQHLTPREYLSITQRVKKLPPSTIEYVLEIVDMSDHIDSRVATFSLGMKQRIALAQALLGQPKLLILDEPTNGLDPTGIKEMRTLIASLPERTQCTVFLSSHLLDEIEKTATHVAILRNGTIALQSKLSELIQHKNQSLSIRSTEPDKLLMLLTTHNYTAVLNDTVCVIEDCTENTAIEIHQLMHANELSLIESHLKSDRLENLFHRYNQS